MKKIFAVFVMFAALVFVGCSGDCPCDNNNNGNGNNNNNGNAGDTDPALVGEWRYTFNHENGINTMNLYYMFNLDGTGYVDWRQYDINFGEIIMNSGDFYWTVQNHTILLEYTNTIEIQYYIIKDGNLYIKNYIFQKIK